MGQILQWDFQIDDITVCEGSHSSGSSRVELGKLVLVILKTF